MPSKTLKEQWRKRIEDFCQNPDEWEVQTYQYITQYHMDEYQQQDIALTIFDERYHLPANSFSKLATINTTYRMGLSASPYREDGGTDYIFALTGYPVGLKWRSSSNWAWCKSRTSPSTCTRRTPRSVGTWSRS